MTLVPPVSGRRGLVVLAAALGTVAALSIWSWRSRPQPEPMAAPLSVETPQPRGVSALGRLNPAGNVRRLDAPSGAMGASPRVETLLVEEGDRVEAGQVLARFDTHPDQLADFEVAKATIASLEQRQALLQREVQRYERLLQSGAISAETLDVRKIKLLTVQQELRKAKAELQRQRIKLPDGELVAPFSGTVLEIFARPGERPGLMGCSPSAAAIRWKRCWRSMRAISAGCVLASAFSCKARTAALMASFKAGCGALIRWFSSAMCSAPIPPLTPMPGLWRCMSPLTLPMRGGFASSRV